MSMLMVYGASLTNHTGNISNSRVGPQKTLKPVYLDTVFTSDVDLRNPLQNMNQSEIVIMMKSGLGIRVHESYGMLDVMVSLPPSYNTTCKVRSFHGF